MTKSDNGAHELGGRPADTMILTFDRVADHLEIGGSCNSLDLMLDMLGRATRALETRYRREQALLFKQDTEEAQRVARLVQQVSTGR